MGAQAIAIVPSEHLIVVQTVDLAQNGKTVEPVHQAVAAARQRNAVTNSHTREGGAASTLPSFLISRLL